jgi:hypothetical protein
MTLSPETALSCFPSDKCDDRFSETVRKILLELWESLFCGAGANNARHLFQSLRTKPDAQSVWLRCPLIVGSLTNFHTQHLFALRRRTEQPIAIDAHLSGGSLWPLPSLHSLASSVALLCHDSRYPIQAMCDQSLSFVSEF